MDKNTLYPIISVLLVIIAALAVYYVADMFGGTEIHHGDDHGDNNHEEHTEEAEELFFEAIRKPLHYDEYVYAYEEKASNGYTNNVFITSSPNISYVKKEDAIFTRELFILQNDTILCLENVNKKVCSEVTQESSFNAYTYTLRGLFFDHDLIEKTEENNELLVKYGAVVFSPEVQHESFEGRECKDISYTLDYSKLTLEQMRVIGMDPKSPEVLISKKFVYTLCIDSETFDVLHKTLSYMNFGEPESIDSLSTEIIWGSSTEPEIPNDLADEVEMEDFFSALKMSQDNYRECLASEEFEVCIRSEAILSRNEKLCELILNTTHKDICYVNVALEKEDSLLCAMASSETRDACYMEFAWKDKDTAYCEQITAPVMKQECMVLEFSGSGNETSTEDETEPEEQREYSDEAPENPECNFDLDCATAGCSSQLCVPRSLSDVVTSCEYLPEYDCLEHIDCGCSNNVCGWSTNQEYLNCLDEKKTQ